MNEVNIVPEQEILKGINRIYVEGNGFEPILLGKRHKKHVSEMIRKSFDNIDMGASHFILSQFDNGNVLYLGLTDTGSVYFIDKVLPSLHGGDALDMEKKYLGVNINGDESMMVNVGNGIVSRKTLNTILSSNMFESSEMLHDEEIVGPRDSLRSKYDDETGRNVPLSDTHDYIMTRHRRN